MMRSNRTNDDVCARKMLGPWLVMISVLIIVTIIATFYFADDIRRNQSNRGQMKIGVFNLPGQAGGRPARSAAKLAAFTPPWHSQQNPDAMTGATPKTMSFNQAIGIVAPSVVGINTSGAQQLSASGIIVHHFGYVLTNHHVVNGAESIVVTLNYDQLIKSYPAKIFDSREDLDLAIIKISSAGKQVFAPAPLGDSDSVYIGQEVVAIGNPFGLTQSASSGIISNADRTLTAGERSFKGLIQTDASLNPGSSGGALVNTKGEVIGVNTAIYSSTQAFSGISFAIPINQAKNVFADFMEIAPSPLAGTNAQVAQANSNGGMAYAPPSLGLQMMAAKGPARERCWLGISAYPVDNAVAKQLDLPTLYGVLVNRVLGNSPAAKAGLVKGDVIFRADNKRIKDANMLWSLLADKMAGDTITLALFRNNGRKTLKAKLESRPPDTTTQTQALPSPRAQNAAGKEFIEGHWLGLEVIPLIAELATEYQVSQGEPGVLVDEVTLEAAESGILAGDMVQSIDSFPTPDLKAFFQATQRVQEEERAQVRISRRGRKMSFFMRARNSEMLGFAQMEAAQPIQPGALRPHRYMGSCTKCHVFMQAGGQLPTDAGDILPNPPPITRNAKPPHRDRGQCAACHIITDRPPNAPVITRNAKPPHGYRGRCDTCHTIR